MTKFEQNKKDALELKGNYLFKSPYHKSKKMLPFNVLGTVSFNPDFPIEAYTVEYSGWTKKDVYTSYKYEDLKREIETGKLIKILQGGLTECKPKK